MRHSEWRWLPEGQQCQPKEFVRQRLVFTLHTADGFLNKGAQPGGQVEVEPMPPSPPARHMSFSGGDMPSPIYPKVPEPREHCRQFTPPPDLLTTGSPGVTLSILSPCSHGKSPLLPHPCREPPRNRALPLSCDHK